MRPKTPSSRPKSEKPFRSAADAFTALSKAIERGAVGRSPADANPPSSDATPPPVEPSPGDPSAIRPTACPRWALPLMRHSLARAARVVGADRAAIARPADDGSLRLEALDLAGAADATGDEETLPAEPGGSLAAHALSLGEAVRSERLDAEQRFSDSALVRRGVVAAAAVPLVADGCRFGVLVVGRSEPRPFGDDEARRLGCAGEALTALLSALWSDETSRAEEGGPPRATADRSRRNRRRSARLPYRYTQSITPLLDRDSPELIDLSEVECDDISSGGISLVLDSPPPFEKFIIALGRGANRVRLGAKVVNARPVERDGRRVFLVGCEFLNRLDR